MDHNYEALFLIPLTYQHLDLEGYQGAMGLP